MRINLHIERLILDGLPLEPGQGRVVKAAVEAELTRMIAGQGISSELMTGGAVPSVSANGIQIAPGAKPAVIGREIARSVYGGLGR